MSDTEERLSKRSDALKFAIGKARAEKISGDGAVNTRAENIVGMIAAKIGYGADNEDCEVRDNLED